VGLVGPNGAGKTTLARLFRGLDRASEGSLLVEGREVERESVSGLAGTVAYTFQEPAHLFMRSRVDAELRLSGELLGLDEAEALARLEDALDLFSLRPHAATHPRELPASAASLLGVALSWFSRARVQILDEPLARLDKPGREVLERVLSAWRQEGITVVVVAHDLDWLCTVCTSIAVLDGGAIVAQGHPGEVLARSQVSAILGRPVFLPGASGRS